MSIEKENINWIDALELAAYITETTNYFDNDKFDQVEEAVIEMFDCDMYGFTQIISRLLPMVMISKSALSETKTQGFADMKKHLFILKRELPIGIKL